MYFNKLNTLKYISTNSIYSNVFNHNESQSDKFQSQAFLFVKLIAWSTDRTHSKRGHSHDCITFIWKNTQSTRECRRKIAMLNGKRRWKTRNYWQLPSSNDFEWKCKFLAASLSLCLSFCLLLLLFLCFIVPKKEPKIKHMKHVWRDKGITNNE